MNVFGDRRNRAQGEPATTGGTPPVTSFRAAREPGGASQRTMGPAKGHAQWTPVRTTSSEGVARASPSERRTQGPRLEWGRKAGWTWNSGASKRDLVRANNASPAHGASQAGHPSGRHPVLAAWKRPAASPQSAGATDAVMGARCWSGA